MFQTYGFGLASAEALKSIIWSYCVFGQSIGLPQLSLKVQGYRKINPDHFLFVIQVQICNFQTGKSQ